MTDKAERQARWAAKAQQSGRRRVEVWLSDEALTRLDAMVKESGARGRAEALEALLAPEPAPPKRKRCPRTNDEGVETRRDGDGLTVILDGRLVGTIRRDRGQWRGETIHGETTTGRTANATANRVLQAVHRQQTPGR